MRYGTYVQNKQEFSYSEFFNEGKPVEIHLKALVSGTEIVYLVHKHKGVKKESHAQFGSHTKVLESYTDISFEDYRRARRHFLWLSETELVMSNSEAKHVLERWED